MSLFPRYFRPGVVATVAGQVAKNLGLPPPAPAGPRVSFRVRRTLTPTPDTATLTLYNLAPDRVASMSTLFAEVGRTPVALAAGYDGVTPQLFAGDLRELDTDRQIGPTDTALVATADDGGDALATVQVTYSTAGWTVANMIEVALAAFSASGAPLRKHPSVDAAVKTAIPASTRATFAAAHVGRASQLFDEAARILGVRWWVRDTQLFMARRGRPVDAQATLLPKTHWLGTPSLDGSGLLRLPVLFDPNLLPGRQVLLEGRSAPGTREPFRVEATDHAGDTHSAQAWSVALTLRRIAP